MDKTREAYDYPFEKRVIGLTVDWKQKRKIFYVGIVGDFTNPKDYFVDYLFLSFDEQSIASKMATFGGADAVVYRIELQPYGDIEVERQ